MLAERYLCPRELLHSQKDTDAPHPALPRGMTGEAHLHQAKHGFLMPPGLSSRGTALEPFSVQSKLFRDAGAATYGR